MYKFCQNTCSNAALPSWPRGLLVISILATQDTLATAAPSPPAGYFAEPLGQREAPVSSDQHAADDVDEFNAEEEDGVAVLSDGQQDRLNVVLNEHARNHVLGNAFALFRNGVLVRGDGVVGTDGVLGRYNREIVLELVEVILGNVKGAVEGVYERWIVRAER